MIGFSHILAALKVMMWLLQAHNEMFRTTLIQFILKWDIGDQ